MSYARLMVHLELGKSNAALLTVAGDLAERSHASLVGIAAAQPLVATPYAGAFISGEAIELDRAEIEREAKVAQSEFQTILSGRVADLEWRCMETTALLSDYLASEARSVDVIVTAPDRGGGLLPDTRRTSVGDLVMRAGRPVIIVPTHATGLKPERALVAWKDCREARRAALDALPLLEISGHVTVVEVARKEDEAAARRRLTDVADWLKRHGILAEILVSPATGDDVAALSTLARAERADVIVAGAYGHSRLREWTFGGMTADLLLNPACCVLLSR
ncbi:universal stress protein [Sphingomonas histidinilytica]|uniref:universal stress protein n=1 Tax=Rhizorhabdus histidinilytica TaxID=439228 RepID=UPI001ADD1408|nr:universal stress protein [Rhizorhabdus histidinilytica]MBO9380700.1 universal stress protein [Rhizorhabdus histidinilytica]